MGDSYFLLRDALTRLSLEPDEQRAALAGSAVTDELALDFANAVESIGYQASIAGVDLAPAVLEAVRDLNGMLGAAPPGDWLWTEEALDRHPLWAEARTVARTVLSELPAD